MMTPDERTAARERLNLFLHAEGGGSPVSRAELAGYLVAALKQIDDDERLMLRAYRFCNPNLSVPFEEHEDLLRDLCARRAPAPEETAAQESGRHPDWSETAGEEGD